MKKLFISLVVVAFIGISATAQNQFKGKNDFTPEQRATLQAKKLALALNLNESQEDAVFKLQKQQAVKRDAMRKAMQERRLKGTKLNSDERFQLEKNKLDNMEAHQKAMQNILTPEQFKEWKNIQKAKFKRRHSKKGGMRGQGPRQ
ncbi:MAG: hypothetical protein ACWA42_08900 [Lutibacter sp.]